MAKAFLDTSYLLDIFMRRTHSLSDVGKNDLYFSPLSFPAISYIHKLHVPNSILTSIMQDMFAVNLTSIILKKSLVGPTPDIEDNVQLHSASSAHCDYFLTSDKKLLKLGYFGETEIVSKI